MFKLHTFIEFGEQSVETLKNKASKTLKKFWEDKADPLADVMDAEEEYLDEFYEEQEKEKIFGLALSGGGIRSAAFSIGIIQALNNKNILKKTSYLSTVSGGGFAGSALTWYLTEENVFPFGHKDTYTGSQKFDSVDSYVTKKLKKAQKRKTTKQISADDKEKSNEILSYIRHHGNYLTPYHLGKTSLAARGILSVGHSALSYLLAFSFVLFWLIVISEWVDLFMWKNSVLTNGGTNFFELLFNLLETYKDIILSFLDFWGKSDLGSVGKTFTGFYILVALIIAALFVIISLVFALVTFFAKKETPLGYKIRVLNQRVLGWLLIIFIGSLVVSVLPVGFEILAGGASEREMVSGNGEVHEHAVVEGIGSATGTEPEDGKGMDQGFQGLLRLVLFLTPSIIGAILAIYKFRKDLGGEGIAQNRYYSFAVSVVVLALIFSVLTLSFTLAKFFYKLPLFPLILVLVLTYLVPRLVNINLVSMHRVYRDRLAETFLWDPSTDPNDRPEKKGNKASQTLLSKFEEPRKKEEGEPVPLWVPYHLINTNVVFTNAEGPKYRGRHGDNFILSPIYCGSKSTGYEKTKDFLGGHLTLATAMAASGAAVNPNAGVSGGGLTVNPLMSFLMTFFGLRLGLWVLNPAIPAYKFLKKTPPNYISPGLKSLLGYGQKEESARFELTDGGHFDNTGLYELFRRRVPNIILCDGTADQKFTFDDLGNALERARVDFGVVVKFDKNYKLSKLLPGSYETHSKSRTAKLLGEKYGLSHRGMAIAQIFYPKTEGHPKESEGRLFYFKAVMVDNLPADIAAYKAKNPTFPSQSTVDQFFDERQFESYRELGYRLAKPQMSIIHRRAVRGRK